MKSSKDYTFKIFMEELKEFIDEFVEGLKNLFEEEKSFKSTPTFFLKPTKKLEEKKEKVKKKIEPATSSTNFSHSPSGAEITTALSSPQNLFG